MSIKLGRERPLITLVMINIITSNRRLEVPGVGQAVGADWPEFGEFEVILVELEDVAADGAVGEGDAVADSAGYHADFVGAD